VSFRLVGETNPQQIEVTQFALIVDENEWRLYPSRQNRVAGNGDNFLPGTATIGLVAVFGDYTRQCARG